VAKAASPLAAFVKQIKDDGKAKRSPGTALKKIIDDYCASGEFDQYLWEHRADMARYVEDHQSKRPGIFRGSAAGKCLQQQVYGIVGEPGIEPHRPARQLRALQNGTFVHIRYHMLFDALHEKGLVRTVAAEERRCSPEIELAGTIDRLINFEFDGNFICAVIDMKSIKSKYFMDLVEPQEDHTLQAHAYDFLDWNADFWMMLYEDKDTHDLKIYEAPYSDIVKQRLRNNYASMSQWITQYEAGVPFNERIKLPLNVKWCQYCPYQLPCLEEHPDLPKLQGKA
jgi:hypothetical protein